MFTMDYFAVVIGVIFGIFAAFLFALTIHHIKRSNARCRNQGQLDTKKLWIMLYAQIYYMAIQCMTLFRWYTYGPYEVVVDTLLYTSYFLIEIILVYVLIYFELSSFTLRSNVPGDGSLQIMGIDPNGRELFRFSIDKRAQQNSKHLSGS